MGAVGCVLVPLVVLPLVVLPLVVLPGAVLPVPARCCCMHDSLSRPIMFSHRLRPPGICEGITAGVCEGVIAGVCDGVTAGVWEGVMLGLGYGSVGEVGLGVICAKTAPATARRAAVLRVFNMAIPFIRYG
jgi:hypothetical protein